MFDPSCPVGISGDASDAGVGAVLFHRYKDNTERPIANASKTLTATQKRYPQIQKEALFIIFALKKFHQFLYGRKFILVTDHKPLISILGPNTATPVLAANRLAKWSLMLSQYNYTIEYRPTKQHGNADALSRLPAGPDLSFDGEEGDNDVDTPITKNTTAVFVVYILQIHLPRWFSPTKKTVLLRLQYHDYFYHSHSKKYHSSNRSIIYIPHFMIKLLW